MRNLHHSVDLAATTDLGAGHHDGLDTELVQIADVSRFDDRTDLKEVVASNAHRATNDVALSVFASVVHDVDILLNDVTVAEDDVSTFRIDGALRVQNAALAEDDVAFDLCLDAKD